MSSAFTPIDATTLAALNKGDESALERIFRANYDALLARAIERLGDEKAAAPRLVTAAVRELWEEREGFHSSTEVEGFLNEEFRHRARAIRSRMAAVHRFEKSEGVKHGEHHAPPTVDQLWQEVATALHQPVLDAATKAKRRREHAAHDTAHHIAAASAPRGWKGPAALIVVFGLILWGGYNWMSKTSKASVITQALAASDAPQVMTRPGQLGSVTLADSSVARLGADSKIVMVPKFGTEYRSAMVMGTAAIKVAAGNELPLEVRLGEMSIISTGAELAVRDFGDEPMRYAQARGDGVQLKWGDNERTLKAGEAIAVDRATGAVRDATADEVAQAFSWLDGKLVVKETAVRDVMHELYRWYGLDIAMRDSLTLDRVVSIDVPLESSQAAIAAMEGAGQLKFEWVNSRMTFKDAAPRK